MSLRSPVPWRPPCSSASPVGNEPSSRCGASVQALALRARRPGSLGRTAPMSMGFPSTPARRFRRIGETSRDSSSPIPHAVRCRWSASRKRPTGTSSIPSPPVVGRDHRHSPLAGGAPGEAGGVDPPAPRPSRALWGVPGAAQPSARERHPHPAPAGAGGTGGRDHVGALGLGTAAASGVCAGYGALPVVSARDAAAHRRHHARRGDPQDPPSSETLCRPTPIKPARSRQAPVDWVA